MKRQMCRNGRILKMREDTGRWVSKEFSIHLQWCLYQGSGLMQKRFDSILVTYAETLAPVVISTGKGSFQVFQIVNARVIAVREIESFVDGCKWLVLSHDL